MLPVPSAPASPGQVPPSPTVVTYTAGFNLAASFILTLLDSFDVAGTIVVNGDGVTASIEIADPIDIYVLQITRQGNVAQGPVLAISTEGNSGTMSFMGGLMFFQEPFGVNVTVVATKDAKQNLLVNTTLTPTTAYPPLLSASDSLSFSYSSDLGFTIDDWPVVNQVQDIIDFLSELKSLVNSKGSGCGQIADYVCNDMLGQSYSIGLSFSSDSSTV